MHLEYISNKIWSVVDQWYARGLKFELFQNHIILLFELIWWLIIRRWYNFEITIPNARMSGNPYYVDSYI